MILVRKGYRCHEKSQSHPQQKFLHHGFMRRRPCYYGHYLAFLLRGDGQIPEAYLALFKETVLLVVVTKIFFFFVFNLYRGMWRFTGINDLKNVVAATLLSSMAMTSYFLFLNQLQRYPRSVYVMDFVLTLMFIGGIRVGVRMAME